MTISAAVRSRIFGHNLSDLKQDVEGALGALEQHPDAVDQLEDHELLALDGWAKGTKEVIRTECVRRGEQHQLFRGYLRENQ